MGAKLPRSSEIERFLDLEAWQKSGIRLGYLHSVSAGRPPQAYAPRGPDWGVSGMNNGLRIRVSVWYRSPYTQKGVPKIGTRFPKVEIPGSFRKETMASGRPTENARK